MNRSRRKFHVHNFTDLATVYIAFYLIHYTIPNMTGKIQTTHLKLGPIRKVATYLAVNPEICIVRSDISMEMVKCLIGLFVDGLLNLKHVTKTSKMLLAKVALQQLQPIITS